jgi:hypothetical protein
MLRNRSTSCFGLSSTGWPAETQTEIFSKFSLDPFFALKKSFFHVKILIL